MQDLQEKTGIVPNALRDRPTLDFRQTFYYNVFQCLSGSRNAAMGGVMAIPLSEVVAYFSMFNIAELNERERIHQHVSALDAAYMEYAAEKSKSKSSK